MGNIRSCFSKNNPSASTNNGDKSEKSVIEDIKAPSSDAASNSSSNNGDKPKENVLQDSKTLSTDVASSSSTNETFESMLDDIKSEMDAGNVDPKDVIRNLNSLISRIEELTDWFNGSLIGPISPPIHFSNPQPESAARIINGPRTDIGTRTVCLPGKLKRCFSFSDKEFRQKISENTVFDNQNKRFTRDDDSFSWKNQIPLPRFIQWEDRDRNDLLQLQNALYSETASSIPSDSDIIVPDTESSSEESSDDKFLEPSTISAPSRLLSTATSFLRRSSNRLNKSKSIITTTAISGSPKYFLRSQAGYK